MNSQLSGKMLIAAGLVLISSGVQAASEKAILTNSSWVAEIDAPFYPKRTAFYVRKGRLEKDISLSKQREPFCVVESTKRRSQNLTVEAGATFKILKVSYYDDAHDTTNFIFTTSMQVKSLIYPSITKIECKIWGDQTDSYLSLEEIEKTMAGVFRLEQR